MKKSAERFVFFLIIAVLTVLTGGCKISSGSDSSSDTTPPDHGISATISIPDGTITFSPENQTVTKGNSCTVSVSETSYSSYTWELDGSEQSSAKNSASLIIDTGSLDAGIHTIQLIVTDSPGNTFFGTCHFSVTN
ncbi:MAG: hypothetical protein LKF96_07235 [Treponema sp.]|jgi:hypothetical protein|nr:hypothetical protein [Treponema sp.]